MVPKLSLDVASLSQLSLDGRSSLAVIETIIEALQDTPLVSSVADNNTIIPKSTLHYDVANIPPRISTSHNNGCEAGSTHTFGSVATTAASEYADRQSTSNTSRSFTAKMNCSPSTYQKDEIYSQPHTTETTTSGKNLHDEHLFFKSQSLQTIHVPELIDFCCNQFSPSSQQENNIVHYAKRKDIDSTALTSSLRNLNEKEEITTTGTWTEKCFNENHLEDINEDFMLNQICEHLSRIAYENAGCIVIQKFLEEASESHVEHLSEALTGLTLSLSLNTYGCRILQKALDVVPIHLRTKLTEQLHGHVIQCIRDPNGNYVVQKCVEVLPFEDQTFILEEIDGKASILALHVFGCRVLQRLLEKWPWHLLKNYFDDFVPSLSFLLTDRFGNYVVQHLLEYGDDICKADIVAEIARDLLVLSRHKFASNVIEKALTCCSAEHCSALIAATLGTVTLTQGPQPVLVAMSCDRYANYVVQRMLQVALPQEAASMLAVLIPHLELLKRVFCGRYIATVLKQCINTVSPSNLETVGALLPAPLHCIVEKSQQLRQSSMHHSKPFHQSDIVSHKLQASTATTPGITNNKNSISDYYYYTNNNQQNNLVLQKVHHPHIKPRKKKDIGRNGNSR